MKSIYKNYEPKESLERIEEIVSINENDFEELDYIPDLSKITYSNGYYINCSVLCCDIRKSTELYDKHNRPIIAKIFRSFISEVVAVITSNSDAKEIFIEGDCVWAVFNTPQTDKIDKLFETASQINSMMDLINYKLSKRKITNISAGIGLSYGRVLVIKAGYNGSGINELVWIGPAVGEAHDLASYGNKPGRRPVFLSNVIYANLKKDYKDFCFKSYSPDAYDASVIDTVIRDYQTNNCT